MKGEVDEDIYIPAAPVFGKNPAPTAGIMIIAQQMIH